MNPNELKQAVAEAALAFVRPHLDSGVAIGIGTGSTVDLFIDALGPYVKRLSGAVASSERSAKRLAGYGIRVVELNDVEVLPVYVDGADEIDASFAMIKGGGGALTREKIVAAVARQFVCIADESKKVAVLGRFPLPVEVIPMARAHVARQLVALGGAPKLREGFITDNGNLILDVHGLSISDPCGFETRIDQIAGVVSSGVFAVRGADVLLLGTAAGVVESRRSLAA